MRDYVQSNLSDRNLIAKFVQKVTKDGVKVNNVGQTHLNLCPAATISDGMNYFCERYLIYF